MPQILTAPAIKILFPEFSPAMPIVLAKLKTHAFFH
jgi:hypothetical protein